MKRTLTAIAMFSLTFGAATPIAWAQDGGGADPVEAFYCNLRDGKTMEDVMDVAEDFDDWSDDNDSDYSAWVLTPQFALGALTPDFIWLGAWTDFTNMGTGIDTWRKEGGDLAEAFDEASDCSAGHVLASSVEIGLQDGPPGDGVVMFSQCNVAEGSDRMAAIKAHKGVSKMMAGKGAKASSWVFFPLLGGGEVEYDYLSVLAFNSWTDYGDGFERYLNGGGWQKAREITDGVTSCGDVPPTVWDVKLVRTGEQ